MDTRRGEGRGRLASGRPLVQSLLAWGGIGVSGSVYQGALSIRKFSLDRNTTEHKLGLLNEMEVKGNGPLPYRSTGIGKNVETGKENRRKP